MKRNVLSARTVQTAAVGWHADGGGLYLQVTPGGRSWVYRFRLHGRERYMGLGALRQVSLAEAREKAAAARKLQSEGRDPIETRTAERASERLVVAKATTFDDCAKAYVAAHRAGWKNAKHRQQWENTLTRYVSAIFGSLPVQAINTDLVLKAIEPIWTEKPETASRVRGRIQVVLDWANARGYREGENPARWRGHLCHLLSDNAKIRRVKHHSALPFAELPRFLGDLQLRDGISARALEFTVLTAGRTGETIGATWSEIDLAGKRWTIPASRMKAEKEHRVPLSDRAVEILKFLPREDGNEHVFIGPKSGGPLSNMAMAAVLRRMGRSHITVHGFRSTFRDWAAERTNFPREIVEAALAHAIDNRVEAAYRRGDLFEKRRRLTDAWAKFCGSRRPRGRCSVSELEHELTSAAPVGTISSSSWSPRVLGPVFS
jgi:integrase